MASLNTLRTKFGIVLSIVIALALLAFILSLKTEMGFSGNDPVVGVIDGTKINYSEYYDQYELVKEQNGVRDSDEQQSAMIAGAAWQALISRTVLVPGFERMGLGVSEAERLSIVGGEHPSQSIAGFFGGAYDAAVVAEFLRQAETNPQAQQLWAQINEQARLEREVGKYLGLVRGGAYVNSLEVAEGVDAANERFSGRWVGKRYASVPDSLFEVKGSEIRSYYNDHKAQYKQLPQRTLSYVVFEVAPTDADLEALERTAMETGEEFAATDEVRAFVRKNRNGHISDTYLSEAQMTAEEAAALMNGKMYGPVLKNNEWTMARVLSTKMAPDSLGIRHIVLPYNQEALADSLLTALRAGGDFAQAAATYSAAQTAADGGEVGVLPFATLGGEYAEALAGARTGDIVKIASGDIIQLMQVYRADKPVKHVQVATISYPVEASAATRRDIHSQAGSFTVNAKGSIEAFNEAASAAAVTPRIATLSQGDRTLRGLDDSRDVARWVYGADKGDLSEIFTVGDDYVVAMLTGIDDGNYTPVEQVASSIRAQLLRDKKYDYILAEAAGSTLEEKAASLGGEVADFSDVTFASYYINGPGMEPRLVGAITAADKGVLSAPVKGFSGLYFFCVDNIEQSERQTAEAERVRAQAMSEAMVQQLSLQAVQEMAKIEDLRGKYF